MDNFYFLIAIVLLLIARLMKKMCEYFKLALNIVKIKFGQTTRLESWIFFNTKNLENQNNSMLCKRLNDNKKRAILAFFLKVQSFSSKYPLSRMQCHPKKSLNRWPGLLKNCTPTSHTHRFFFNQVYPVNLDLDMKFNWSRFLRKSRNRDSHHPHYNFKITL